MSSKSAPNIPLLTTAFLTFFLLSALAVATPPAQADNLSSVNLIANGSFDTPGASSFALADGWQLLNPWGSETVAMHPATHLPRRGNLQLLATYFTAWLGRRFARLPESKIRRNADMNFAGEGG